MLEYRPGSPRKVSGRDRHWPTWWPTKPGWRELKAPGLPVSKPARDVFSRRYEPANRRDTAPNRGTAFQIHRSYTETAPAAQFGRNFARGAAKSPATAALPAAFSRPQKDDALGGAVSRGLNPLVAPAAGSGSDSSIRGKSRWGQIAPYPGPVPMWDCRLEQAVPWLIPAICPRGAIRWRWTG